MNETIPEFLSEMLLKEYGNELTNQIIDRYKLKRVTTFRVNTLKANAEEIENTLTKLKIEYEKSQWNKEAFIIRNESADTIKEMDIYKEGKIYLQSLSSMLPPIILNPKEGTDILDMASAPGGKTTQLATLTNNKAHITACEMNKIRAEKLKYNIEKQGATSVYVMEVDSRRLNDYFSFDQVLLDSPCSGSGTIMAEDINLEKYFTEKLINKCKKTQRELLAKAIKVLKPGKEMVYSTCSILAEENEEIVGQAIERYGCEIVPIYFEKMEEIPTLPTKIEGTLCVAPNELYEGFFVAKIKKIK